MYNIRKTILQNFSANYSRFFFLRGGKRIQLDDLMRRYTKQYKNNTFSFIQGTQKLCEKWKNQSWCKFYDV